MHAYRAGAQKLISKTRGAGERSDTAVYSALLLTVKWRETCQQQMATLRYLYMDAKSDGKFSHTCIIDK